MSKAILIMDMPESCTKCDLGKSGMCCIKNFSTQMMSDYRASICPLKEEPGKKEVPNLTIEHDHFLALGYNTCIDEILGGSDV